MSTAKSSRIKIRIRRLNGRSGFLLQLKRSTGDDIVVFFRVIVPTCAVVGVNSEGGGGSSAGSIGLSEIVSGGIGKRHFVRKEVHAKLNEKNYKDKLRNESQTEGSEFFTANNNFEIGPNINLALKKDGDKKEFKRPNDEIKEIFKILDKDLFSEISQTADFFMVVNVFR